MDAGAMERKPNSFSCSSQVNQNSRNTIVIDVVCMFVEQRAPKPNYDGEAALMHVCVQSQPSSTRRPFTFWLPVISATLEIYLERCCCAVVENYNRPDLLYIGSLSLQRKLTIYKAPDNAAGIHRVSINTTEVRVLVPR